MDPRLAGPQQRKANYSRLMEALGRASQGETINACPFGCEDNELDELGYCHHLVGFTKDGKYMEVLTKDSRGRPYVSGVHKALVKKTDKLERVTTSFRVYRDMPKPKTDEPEFSEEELANAGIPIEQANFLSA
jgi:hypothetical protein